MKSNRSLYIATPYNGEIKYYSSIRNCVFDLNLPVGERAVAASIKRKGYWDNGSWFIAKGSFL